MNKSNSFLTQDWNISVITYRNRKLNLATIHIVIAYTLAAVLTLI